MLYSEKSEKDIQRRFMMNHPDPGSFQKEDFVRNSHPDAQWFPEAGLGLFLHWGISSVSGQYDLSWGMMKQKDNLLESAERKHGPSACARNVPPMTYWQNVFGFDASHYEPERWLEAAARAGFKYAVLTAKHHDGYALWPSEYGEFNTKTYLGGRDLVGEFVEACRKCGLKVGLYYANSDWYLNYAYMNFNSDSAGTPLDYNWKPVDLQKAPAEHRQALREYNKNQVTELLTRYGKIDILWFDGYGADCITVMNIRRLQPGILINDRGRLEGDFSTRGAELIFPRARREGWWEYCHSLSNGGWGYRDHEIYKPAGWLLAELAKARAWGGNFLVNAAPDAHGEMPPVFYRRLAKIEAWMRLHADSVTGRNDTKYWPDYCNVPVTRSGSSLFLHFHWLADYPVVITDILPPKTVTLDGTVLEYRYNAADRSLRIVVPPELLTCMTAVIRLEYDHPV